MSRAQERFERRLADAVRQYPEPFPDLIAVSEPAEWCQATDLTWDEAVIVSEMEAAMMAENLEWQNAVEDMASQETDLERAIAFNRWAR